MEEREGGGVGVGGRKIFKKKIPEPKFMQNRVNTIVRFVLYAINGQDRVTDEKNIQAQILPPPLKIKWWLPKHRRYSIFEAKIKCAGQTEQMMYRHITKTCPCNMQQFLKVEKMIIFR